jgi:putative endonuclease
MHSHTDTGREGEALATHWMRLRGYQILERNWRHGRLELDIIAELDGVIHFVEVKTKRSTRFGHPEQEAHPAKIRHVMKAAGAYMALHAVRKKPCIDVLAISISRLGVADFLWIEDVYL